MSRRDLFTNLTKRLVANVDGWLSKFLAVMAASLVMALVIIDTGPVLAATEAQCSSFFNSANPGGAREPRKPGDTKIGFVVADCFPGYIRDLGSQYCSSGGTDRYGLIWAASSKLGNLHPKYGIMQIESGDMSNEAYGVGLYSTIYYCKVNGTAPVAKCDSPMGVWHQDNTGAPSDAVKNCNKSYTIEGTTYKTTDSNNKASSFIKFNNNVINRGRTPNSTEAGATSDGETYSGFNSGSGGSCGSGKSTASVNLKKFKELCDPQSPGVKASAQTCKKSGTVSLNGKTYDVWSIGITQAYYKSGANCQNVTAQVLKLVMTIPPASISVSPFVTSVVSRTKIYPGQTATFTHDIGATATGSSTDSINVTFTTGAVADPGGNTNGISNPSSPLSKTLKVTKDNTALKPAKDSMIESHVATVDHIGKTFCRRVSWSYTKPGDAKATTGNGAVRCVEVIAPTFTVTPTVKTETDKFGDKNGYISPGSVINFTHSFSLGLSTNYPSSFTMRFTAENADNNTLVISNPVNPLFKDVTLNYGTVPANGTLPVRDLSDSGTLVESHEATQAHVGGQICRRVGYSATNPINKKAISGDSGGICIAIPYQYELTPHVEVGGKTSNIIVVPGTTDIPITGTLKNSDATKSLNNTEWILAQFRLESGQQPGAMGYDSDKVNATHPSGLFNPNGSYLRLGNGTGSIDYNEIKKVITETFTVPADAKVGQKYCFALSVKPYKAEWKDGQGQVIHDNWRHSLPICVIVAKQPVTQVHGAGLILPQGGAKGYLTTRPTNDKYGSWIEYDILSAKETETAVASNAGHLIQYGLAADALWHQLTIANTPTKGQYGSNLPSNRATVIKDHYINLAKSKTITGHSPEIDLTSYTPNSGLNYLYHSGSNLRLKGTLPAGKSLVIIQDSGDVIIEQNLIYAKQSQFGSARDYSQLIIIANNGNIIVNDNVSRIDAWLVALGKDANQGRLKTCQYSEVSVNRCANQLVVNGPVIVDYIDLMRTYGNDVTSLGAPAEVFNFRPDAYLWSLGNNSGIRPVYETTYSRELPPRY